MRKSLHFEGMHNLSAVQPVNLLIPVDSDEHALLTVIAYHGPGQLIVYRNAVSDRFLRIVRPLVQPAAADVADARDRSKSSKCYRWHRKTDRSGGRKYAS